MKKNSFEYQDFFLRTVLGGVIMVALLAVAMVLKSLTDGYTYVIFLVVAEVLSASIYFDLSKNWSMFRRVGEYEIVDGKLVVRMGKEEKRFSEIKELYLTSLSDRDPVIKIADVSKQIDINLYRIRNDETFLASPLYQMMLDILETNPDLKEYDKYHYRVK